MTHQHTSGKLFGIGVGPGDPELLTLKAIRHIQEADVIAYHCARPGSSIARRIASDHFPTGVIEEELCYPVTTQTTDHPGGYRGAMNDFYADCAERLTRHLEAGRTVAVISEGDPLVYGSYQHLHRRLKDHYDTTVVPGVPSFIAAAGALGTPLVEHNQVLSVIPGTLPHAQLVQHLGRSDGAVVMKLGRNFSGVKDALNDSGVLSQARYAERVGHTAERLADLADVAPDSVPYMSVAVVPAPLPNYYDEAFPGNATQQPAPHPHNNTSSTPETAAAGEVVVVGLGPGRDDHITPAVHTELAAADHIIGYTSYVNRVPVVPGQHRHGTDNQAEQARAEHALQLAATGAQVVVVSSGDPGIFAMATAVVEAADEPRFRHIRVRVEPGITAAQAAAARIGAPLGHDFAILSLSDRLKPWAVIEERLAACARADLAIAIYNPASRTRTHQIARAKEILLATKKPDTPVIIAKSVGRDGEEIQVTTLADWDPSTITMAHLLIVGTTHTRVSPGPDGARVWTSRRYERPGE